MVETALCVFSSPVPPLPPCETGTAENAQGSGGRGKKRGVSPPPPRFRAADCGETILKPHSQTGDLHNMSGTAIEIKNATLKLEGKEILHSLNWSVNRGEHWFILGPNGAGKTTLVKMILGLIWPLYGAEITVLGNRYGTVNLFDVRKKIAWASPFLQAWTNSVMNSQCTVMDVVLSGIDSTVGFYRKAKPEEIEKASGILELLGALKLADRAFERVSSGEQVKALIGRTLIADPELLILDETCVHLDLKSREILLDSIESIAARSRKTTILFVTQRLEEITASFQHGMILGGGRITAQGKRSDILTPENLKAAFDIDLKLLPGPGGRLWPLPV